MDVVRARLTPSGEESGFSSKSSEGSRLSLVETGAVAGMISGSGKCAFAGNGTVAIVGTIAGGEPVANTGKIRCTCPIEISRASDSDQLGKII
jgi:hypothetical protein